MGRVCQAKQRSVPSDDCKARPKGDRLEKGRYRSFASSPRCAVLTLYARALGNCAVWCWSQKESVSVSSSKDFLPPGAVGVAGPCGIRNEMDARSGIRLTRTHGLTDPRHTRTMMFILFKRIASTSPTRG